MDMPKTPESNHGFSLLGRKSLVLSHIPMFMAPHQAQLFLEVTLAGKNGGDPTKAYLDDQAKSKSTNYVLVSDPLLLTTLAPHATNRLKTFTGKLYRGWPFDTPNTAPVIVEALTVHVVRSIYFRNITHDALLKDLTYLAFANGDDRYLVHKLVQPPDLSKAPKPPDFVQILSATIEGGHAGVLHHVAEISFPGIENNAAHKLQPHATANGTMQRSSVKVCTADELIYDPNHLTM